VTDRGTTTLEPPSIAPDAMAPDEVSGIRSPALTFDVQKYQRFVEDSGLSESQQQELLKALWAIIVGFVDLGFNLNAVQFVSENSKLVDTESSSVLELGSIPVTEQTTVAREFSERAERVDS
jgi:hypothetical protein